MSPFNAAGRSCLEGEGQGACEPCLFVNRINKNCPLAPRDLKESQALLFRQRVLLAGPVSRLTRFLARSLGHGCKAVAEFKACAGRLLSCEERLLSSVRALGDLQKTCPRLAELRLARGFTSFWSMAELFRRAVDHNVGSEMRQHALARIKLRLAKRAGEEGRQHLSQWLVFLQAEDDQEDRRLLDDLGCRDLWEAAEKVYGERGQRQ